MSVPATLDVSPGKSAEFGSILTNLSREPLKVYEVTTIRDGSGAVVNQTDLTYEPPSYVLEHGKPTPVIIKLPYKTIKSLGPRPITFLHSFYKDYDPVAKQVATPLGTAVIKLTLLEEPPPPPPPQPTALPYTIRQLGHEQRFIKKSDGSQGEFVIFKVYFDNGTTGEAIIYVTARLDVEGGGNLKAWKETRLIKPGKDTDNYGAFNYEIPQGATGKMCVFTATIGGPTMPPIGRPDAIILESSRSMRLLIEPTMPSKNVNIDSIVMYPSLILQPNTEAEWNVTIKNLDPMPARVYMNTRLRQYDGKVYTYSDARMVDIPASSAKTMLVSVRLSGDVSMIQRFEVELYPTAELARAAATALGSGAIVSRHMDVEKQPESPTIITINGITMLNLSMSGTTILPLSDGGSKEIPRFTVSRGTPVDVDVIFTKNSGPAETLRLGIDFINSQYYKTLDPSLIIEGMKDGLALGLGPGDIGTSRMRTTMRIPSTAPPGTWMVVAIIWRGAPGNEPLTPRISLDSAKSIRGNGVYAILDVV